MSHYPCGRCGIETSTTWYPVSFGPDVYMFDLCDRCARDFWEFMKEGSQIAEDRRKKEAEE